MATMNNIEKIIRQMSNENTARTFAFNSSEALKERQWSTEMSNTSHQREVADLKRAGLNPVLSANGGASAYSASSASGSADTTGASMVASLYLNKMNNDNAVKIAKINQQTEKLKNKNAVQVAKIGAAASKYASDKSSAASKYASDNAYTSSIYSSDNAYSASRYASDNAYNSSIYSSDTGYKSAKYKTDFSKSGQEHGFVDALVFGGEHDNVGGKLGKTIRNKISDMYKSYKKTRTYKYGNKLK